MGNWLPKSLGKAGNWNEFDWENPAEQDTKASTLDKNFDMYKGKDQHI